VVQSTAPPNNIAYLRILCWYNGQLWCPFRVIVLLRNGSGDFLCRAVVLNLYNRKYHMNGNSKSCSSSSSSISDYSLWSVLQRVFVVSRTTWWSCIYRWVNNFSRLVIVVSILRYRA
jgi:hypothetical protein